MRGREEEREGQRAERGRRPFVAGADWRQRLEGQRIELPRPTGVVGHEQPRPAVRAEEGLEGGVREVARAEQPDAGDASRREAQGGECIVVVRERVGPLIPGAHEPRRHACRAPAEVDPEDHPIAVHDGRRARVGEPSRRDRADGSDEKEVSREVGGERALDDGQRGGVELGAVRGED